MPRSVIPIMNSYVKKAGDKVEETTHNIKSDIKVFYEGWRQFAFKDNITNVAIGMIIATSFKNAVNSFMVDIIMPCLIGFGTGSNTEDLFIILKKGPTNNTYITLKQAKDDGAVTLNYGLFLNVFIDLLFISFILYITLKTSKKVKKSIANGIDIIESV